MKKILSLALVLAMVLTMSVTAFATEITGNSGSVDITYTYEAPVDSYIVTIPDSMTLGTDANVSAGDVAITAGYLLTVSVSSQQYDGGWKLSNGTNTLDYTLKIDGADIENNGTVLTAKNGDTAVTKTLVTALSGTPIYSGNYTDTLTFNVSIVECNHTFDENNMCACGVVKVEVEVDLSALTETYTITDDRSYEFTGSGSHGIKVESGNPTIVLNNASIMVGEGSAIDVASGSNATIFVLGDNTIGTIDSWNDVPSGGIFVAEGGTVNITSNGTDNILRAHGTHAAAIGGKYIDGSESYNAGSISISNVTVYAYTNNFYAAAIGAAGRGSCGTINITNAVVYAYGAGDRYTSTPGIGSAWDHMGWAETIPVVIISGSEIHTFRYNPYSDYIGYLGDEMGEEGGFYATGSINCGEGGSVKSSTIYCYTGLDATTTDRVVTYNADGTATEN